MDWKNLVHTYIRAYTPLPSQADADENEENPGKRRCGYSHSSLLLSMILLISVSLNVWFVHKLSDLNLLCSRYTSLYGKPHRVTVNKHRTNTEHLLTCMTRFSIYCRTSHKIQGHVIQRLVLHSNSLSRPSRTRHRCMMPPHLYQLNQSRCANLYSRRSSFKVWTTTRTSKVLSKSRRWVRSKYRGVPSFTLFEKALDILKVHYTHCLDILRQQIMCTADTGVFGQWWVKDIGPFVDFNTKHKCKNFEDIRVWAEKKQVRDGEREVEFRMRIWTVRLKDTKEKKRHTLVTLETHGAKHCLHNSNAHPLQFNEQSRSSTISSQVSWTKSPIPPSPSSLNHICCNAGACVNRLRAMLPAQASLNPPQLRRGTAESTRPSSSTRRQGNKTPSSRPRGSRVKGPGRTRQRAQDSSKQVRAHHRGIEEGFPVVVLGDPRLLGSCCGTSDAGSAVVAENGELERHQVLHVREDELDCACVDAETKIGDLLERLRDVGNQRHELNIQVHVNLQGADRRVGSDGLDGALIDQALGAPLQLEGSEHGAVVENIDEVFRSSPLDTSAQSQRAEVETTTQSRQEVVGGRNDIRAFVQVAANFEMAQASAHEAPDASIGTLQARVLQTATFMVLARRLEFDGDAAQKVCEELSMGEGLGSQDGEEVVDGGCGTPVQSQCLISCRAIARDDVLQSCSVVFQVIDDFLVQLSREGVPTSNTRSGGSGCSHCDIFAQNAMETVVYSKDDWMQEVEGLPSISHQFSVSKISLDSTPELCSRRGGS
ncbi:hypothetical protein KCU79_g41, partial [Aureobasidium melanogenum]